jgi:uncharacterized protein YegJ (DUF2314 family)
MVVAALLAATVAFAGTQFDYSSGNGVIGAGGHSTGFDARDYNRVYHASGYIWAIEYTDTSGNIYGFVQNANNPTSNPNPIGYGRTWCASQNDNSNVTYTCQTTHT